MISRHVAGRGLRARMEARGLAGTMMLGMLTDYRPNRQETEALNEVSRGLPWVSHAHHGGLARTRQVDKALRTHGVIDG